MRSMQATIVEERWTPTTIQTTFVLPTPELRKGKGTTTGSCIYINLPFPIHLGTFALSVECSNNLKYFCPMAFSFHRDDSATPCGETSICAQLSLQTVKQRQSNSRPIEVEEELLGTIALVLAETPSMQVPITRFTARSNLSILPPNKLSLTVTISDCALPDGLFQAHPSPVNEGRTQAHLVRQSCDHRLLSQLLATGKPFDVKFLTPSTRSASGETGDPLPTYASLSVVEEHVDISSSVLREGWINALAPLDDKAGTKYVREISCSDEYDHELDSDFEDENEVPPPCNSSSERDLASREDGGTERSSSSFSSFDLERVSDQGLVDEEIINVKSLKESSPDADCERTVEIKFAAHRTWRAFLWYCYTGNIEFSKLRSQIEPGGRHLYVTPLEGGEPPACSPKSMYRLAVLVGNEDLKTKALSAIKERMIEENVLDEAFSIFTSKYPKVRQVQLDALKEHRRSPKVKQAFLGAIEKFSSMPHAKPVLSAFYDDLVA